MDAAPAEVEAMIKQFDSDGNGEIDFSEFVSMMSSKLKELNNETVIDDVFKIFDSGNLFLHMHAVF